MFRDYTIPGPRHGNEYSIFFHPPTLLLELPALLERAVSVDTECLAWGFSTACTSLLHRSHCLFLCRLTMAAVKTAVPLSAENVFRFSEQELMEVAEYEKILRLRDEIFAGKHSQLKISAHAAAIKATPRPVQSPILPTPRQTNGEFSKVCQPGPSTSMSLSMTNGSHGLAGQAKDFLQKSPTTHRTSTSGSSAIDPIFLTKSDDLVKAELQLQRNRIERALEEQVYQRKLSSRLRISDQEAVPDFNISEVFAKALDIVKPTSSAEINGANATAPSSDSFDENTFYSSQVNDSPFDETDNAPTSPTGDTQAQLVVANGLDANFQPKDNANIPQRNGNVTNEGTAQERGPYDLEEQMYVPLPLDDRGARRGRSSFYIQEPRDVHEEPDYSPPAADEVVAFGRNGQVARTNGEQIHEQQRFTKPSKGQVQGDSHGQPHSHHRPASPPSPDVRIVRSHITSPVAPQPARVSPLAVTKVSQLPQDQRHGQNNFSTRGSRTLVAPATNSPENTTQQINPRKRRRAPEGERPRKVTARRIEESPEPYIKPEPLSPPPLSAAPSFASAQNRQRASRPIQVETLSPGEAYQGSLQPRRLQTSHAAYGYPLHSPTSPAIRHVSSKVGLVSRRDDADLRRVASVQYVRRAQSPILDPMQYSPIEVQQPRQSSHAFIERPTGMEHPQYYRDHVPPRGGRYIRAERSLSPQPPRGVYTDVDQTMPVMAPPPPRRIVMDQYGNKYYEAPPSSNVRPSAALPSRYAEVEPAYEGFPARHAPIRAASTVLEPYEDIRYSQRVAPSLPPQQRLVSQHREDDTNYTAYRALDYPEEALVPRQSAAHVLGYAAPRHASHYEEMPSSREPASRMQSVRPVGSRYELAQEYAPRVQSVHPEQQGLMRVPRRQELAPGRVRELSVRVDDDPRVRGEVVATGRPNFEYERQAIGRRNVGQRAAREVIMMDSPSGDERSQGRRF